jgi:hypothetical protein
LGTINLTNPIAGTTITAGLHATNYTLIQTVINGNLDTNNWAAGKIFAPSKLTQEAATDGQVVTWDNATTTWKPKTPASTLEMDYKEVTSNQTSTATTAATATALITVNSVAYDGATAVIVDFTALEAHLSVTNIAGNFNLYDGSTDLGRIASVTGLAGQSGSTAVFGRRRLTPSNASHTFSIRGWVSSASTLTAVAGAGGAGADLPMTLRIYKAA